MGRYHGNQRLKPGEDCIIEFRFEKKLALQRSMRRSFKFWIAPDCRLVSRLDIDRSTIAMVSVLGAVSAATPSRANGKSEGARIALSA